MQGLIERLEKATGPDHELDTDIWLATAPGAKRKKWVYTHTATGKECEVDETRDSTGRLITVPAFTGSLDAALTLVPDFTNRRWYVADSDHESSGRAIATVFHPADVLNGRIPRNVGATPALALCIAALRAREHVGAQS